MVLRNKVNFKKANFCKIGRLNLYGRRNFDNELASGKASPLNW